MFKGNPDSFTRVDESHPLDLYLGSDTLSRSAMFLKSGIEPGPFTSSQIISVSVGLRKDSKWGVTFTLLDNTYEDLFGYFCNDLIESSRNITNKDRGTEYIRNRYDKWLLMFSKSRGEILTTSVIKGLIGEMIFLKNYLIPKYGQEKAIKSWIGPDRADQDFVCEDLWYEVKATDSGAEGVTITSVEQLDTSNTGELVIVYLDKTSMADDSKITLNKLFTDISSLLDNPDLKNKLSGILLNLGYFPRPEYDELAYKLAKFERYEVGNEFPAIRRHSLPNAVISLKYQLSVSSIQKFLKGD